MITIRCLLPIFLLQFFLHCTFSSTITAQNTLKGEVVMPKANKIKIGGLNYNANDPISNAKKKIEAENHPDRNVVISLHPLDFKPTVKPGKFSLTQKEKTFIPHVLPVTQGSVVYIENEDEFYHNVHSKKPFGLFNIGRKEPSVSVPITVEKLGLIHVGCNEHAEMKGFILSLDTPYFTKADENGSYSLQNLPDGNYLLKAFHPHMKRPLSYGEIRVQGGSITEKQINLSRP